MNFDKRWSLNSQRAVVTGGTQGIGKATAEELLRLGSEVLIVARRGEQVQAAVTEWRQAGLPAHGFAADLSSKEGQRDVHGHIQTLWKDGRVDILVNNVGTNLRKTTLQYSDDEVSDIFAINLQSAFQMCRLLHHNLRQSCHASIVNVSSIAGTSVLMGGAPYAMTKAAMDQLTRYLAVEWAADGIRVNGVAPGFVETPLTAALRSHPAAKSAVLEHCPAKRIGKPTEIAAAIAFLCLPAASFVTGSVLTVDGGFSALRFDVMRLVGPPNLGD